VTGGLQTKLQAAAAIVTRGINVTIVRCHSKSAKQVITNQKEEDTDQHDFMATVLYWKES